MMIMPKPIDRGVRMSSLAEQYASTGAGSMLQLMMLAGINPNLKGRDGRTLAHHAALHAVATGNAEAIRKLADYGGCMHSKDALGNSTLDILRLKPSLYDEINKAVLRGVGNAGVKDSRTVDGKTSLLEKKRRNQKTIGQLRGSGKPGRPLRKPPEQGKAVASRELETGLDSGGGDTPFPLRPGAKGN